MITEVADIMNKYKDKKNKFVSGQATNFPMSTLLLFHVQCTTL